ncbi:tRNA (adenosine(37)-N6)-dimethylallyltransferase MiaA [Modestobacter sp. I12A-02628]|uniref:tRNA dimethylallyltransferase n=1 Tax=Goekera deserti TaxID=2497753 RepID=A0A7K3WKB8_9ACTN|nr:tRNA (adenosine(37)-N6)-dimethylallyltransferase MiaA [Goekera deserti]MPQ96368.1 tRNA (adenosine(37)-N6)-dimethylallyltransferase MiaA [Goekera deserti]NDI50536.1 tRNA (adenosine(37)-N6)-dimethylallyltransferase MiaA [Goekera deserti]NEL56150.1 tRNA (adenosine(37)-N6)-dimethylallyltransferase MiaA [Goekera deserti]
MTAPAADGLPPVVAVVGPTATGKTALTVALAQRLGGEVVNADSMQLYRGMDIGTAKPDLVERQGVPHHLLDLWDVREPAAVAVYRDAARAEVDRLRAAGVVPLLVGGSGLYVRAVLDELDFPATDPAVRARLTAELATVGPDELHRRLALVDPAAAAAVLPSNGRRLVRALEVVEITGRPFIASLPQPRPHYPAVSIGLDREPAELDARVATRVDAMWAAGFVTEVQRLAAEGLREGPTASRALGYAQVLQQLDGELSAAEARERTVSTTRRFVRRQRSWFRRDPGVHWFDAARPDLLDAVGAVITDRRIGA